jgi:hypothetical protein
MVKYLCVAEKPSISKSITQILSGGQFNTVRLFVSLPLPARIDLALPPTAQCPTPGMDKKL